MGKKNPYTGMANEQQGQQNKALNQTSGMISGASGALNQFYSPSGMSQYAKTQQAQRESDTNKNFNNSMANQRMRSNLSGFGYQQPAEQAGETNIENARAAELSRIPAETQSDAAKIAMQAIGEQNSLAGTEAGVARTYDPLGYYNTAQKQDQLNQAQSSELWGALGNLAAPFTGGLSKYLFKTK
jgi:hypothetical protein